MTQANMAVLLPKSIRKYIRLHKQNIRRTIIGFNKQRDEIKKLYDKFLNRRPVKTARKATKSLKRNKVK